MKKVIYITILLLVYVLLCGKSCKDESDESMNQVKEVNAEKETIRLAFETDWLNEEARHAQEMAAIQKMGDLADYMLVFTNNSLDSVFRNKAVEMIQNVFVSEEVLLSFSLTEARSNKKVSLGKLLEKGIDQEVLLTELRFESIRVQEHLQKTIQGTYEGILACDQQTAIRHHSDTLQERHPITVEIIIKQREKIFGPDTLEVWECFLGDMKIKR